MTGVFIGPELEGAGGGNYSLFSNTGYEECLRCSGLIPEVKALT